MYSCNMVPRQLSEGLHLEIMGLALIDKNSSHAAIFTIVVKGKQNMNPALW